MNVYELADSYIQLRDKRAALVEEHKKVVEPYDIALTKIEETFLTMMVGMGVDNMKTPAGTVYRAERFTATVKDWDAVLEFVRTHNMWPLLQRRVTKEVVQQYLADTQALPPGVEARREYIVNIRRN